MVNSNNKAYPFLNDYDLDQDVRRRLSLQLDSIVKGSNEVYYTPLGADGKHSVVLKELDVIVHNKSHLINDVLMDMEMSNRDKFGPRSIQIPWKEREERTNISFEADKAATKVLGKYTSSSPILRPVSIETAIKRLKNSTNSGLPYYTRKGKIKSRIVEDYDKYLGKYPCLLFTRTQEGNKTRDVWGVPVMETVRSMRYYIPYQEVEKRLDFRVALLGPVAIDSVMCALVLTAFKLGLDLLSIDFAFFDQLAKAMAQGLGYTFYKSNFQKSYQDELNEIQHTTANIGLLTPSGEKKGPHGMPSGIPETNAVDSGIQFVPALLSGIVNPKLMQVQGDDGVYALKPGTAKILIKMFEQLGLEVNESKSTISREYCTYLQCLYHIYYIRQGINGGIYPVYRALGRLCYQERWSDFEDYDIKGKDYYSIRALCILENCKHHPLFEDLVKLVVKHDKYSLGFSSQGLSNYVRMLDESKGSGGVINNQYGDNVKGIYNFESYKLVKSLS